MPFVGQPPPSATAAGGLTPTTSLLSPLYGVNLYSPGAWLPPHPHHSALFGASDASKVAAAAAFYGNPSATPLFMGWPISPNFSQNFDP